jgi:hypothetical protein
MKKPKATPKAGGLSFERMAIGLLFVALVFRALLMPAQSDTFWLLRDGLQIWRTHEIPRFDSYSFTAAGAPYTDHEWLSEVLLAFGHRWGGMPGMELVAAAAIVGALMLVYRLMVGPLLTRFVILAATLSLSSCVWALRPMVFTLFCVGLLAWLLVRERYRYVPPLFLLWANAHGGVVLGGVLLAAAAATALVRWRVRGEAEDRRRLLALAVVLPLAGVATLLTPLGRHLFGYVIETAGRGHALQITEWDPTLPTDVLGALFWVVALGFWVTLVLRRRALATATWGDWVLVAGAVLLFPIAVRSLRNVSPFLMLAGPAASRLLGPTFRFRLSRANTTARPASPDNPALNLTLLVGATVAALAVLAAGWRSGAGPLDWHPVSGEALGALRGCSGPLYNDYESGGYLIWFAPERPVFVDNRQDPYPLPFLLEHIAVERGQQPYRSLFDRWGIRCAFLPAGGKITKRLVTDGWTTHFRDDRWAVLAAPPAK